MLYSWSRRILGLKIPTTLAIHSSLIVTILAHSIFEVMNTLLNWSFENEL
jgi:hypothetical protein